MLYHCFPRRSYSRILDNSPPTHDELIFGLAVLESIMKFGLLLCPESVAIAPSVDADGIYNPTFDHPRCCFTENELERLSDREVPFPNGHRSHFQIFGPIAIGIENLHGRRLGINPCNYFYRSSAEASDTDVRALSEHLVSCLHEVRNSLVVLAELESHANPDDDYPSRGHAIARDKLRRVGVDFYNEGQNNVVKARAGIDGLTLSNAKAFEDLIANDRYPFWYLTQQLTFLIHLFQDADSQRQTNKRHLAYYSQREWRLVRFFHGNLRFLPISEQATDMSSISEKESEIVQKFLEGCAGLNQLSRRALDRALNVEGCWLLFERGQVHVRDFISEIVVPDAAYRDASRLLQNLLELGAFHRSAPKLRTY